MLAAKQAGFFSRRLASARMPRCLSRLSGSPASPAKVSEVEVVLRAAGYLELGSNSTYKPVVAYLGAF